MANFTNMTSFIFPAGATSNPIPLTPLQSFCVGPAVLGGTFTLETAPSSTGPWVSYVTGSGSSVSYRPTVNTWVRVTPTTQIANATIADLGFAQGTTGIVTLASHNLVMATANLTTIQTLYSLRIPPNYLPLNFRLQVEGTVTVTNNVNVKTLTCLINGPAGTSFFTSPSLASNANYNFDGACCGTGDGATWKGLGSGATGGMGLSTTATTSLVRDYIGQETEIVICGTKAVGTDTMQLDSLAITIF